MNKLTPQDKYLIKVRKKHGERFDLSKVEYINSTTPVKIICKTHGEFEKVPSELLRDGGCRQCSTNNRTSSWTDVLQDFIKIHSDEFDYSKSVYKNNKTKIRIICNKHKVEFEMTPQNHKIFGGCPECRADVYGKHLKLSIEEFGARMKELYGDIYRFDSTEYKGYEYDMNIICKIHGPFCTKARYLLRGSGCPSC